MSRFIRPLMAVAVAFSSLYLTLPRHAVAAGNSGKGGTKEESYIVVQEGEDYKVLPTSGYNDEVKRLKDDYKKKMDLWHDDKKSDPTLSPPKKIIAKKVETGFKTQKGAQDWIDKQLEKEGRDDKAGGQRR